MKLLNTLSIVFACTLASIGWLCSPYIVKKYINRCEFTQIVRKTVFVSAGEILYSYVMDEGEISVSKENYKIGDIVCIRK
jgi:hypothetical protein